MKNIRVQFINKYSTTEYYGTLVKIKHYSAGIWKIVTGEKVDEYLVMLSIHDYTHKMYDKVSFHIDWDGIRGTVNYFAKAIQIVDGEPAKCKSIW